MELKYSYLPCNFCVGKNHCEQCAQEVCDMLLGLPGVTGARAIVGKHEKRLIIDLAPDADENAIFDALETIGVFA